MPKLSFKCTTLILSIFMLACQQMGAQKRADFQGNVRIGNSSLLKVLDGFYDYITDKKNGRFNFNDYYVKVYISSIHDTAGYVEVSLCRYDLSSKERNANDYYGYLQRDKVYFVFPTGHRFISKDPIPENPRIFIADVKDSVLPKAQYDPYRWEVIIAGNRVIEKNPSATIAAYTGLQ